MARLSIFKKDQCLRILDAYMNHLTLLKEQGRYDPNDKLQEDFIEKLLD